jgi:hypothetical protein
MRMLYKKHPSMTWKRLQRRYGLPGQPQESSVVLYNPQAMRVTRYRYRGSKIPTPWNDVESRAPAAQQMSLDDIEFLGGLQERLVG